jgi:hypothetical protein
VTGTRLKCYRRVVPRNVTMGFGWPVAPRGTPSLSQNQQEPESGLEPLTPCLQVSQRGCRCLRLLGNPPL